MMESPMTRSLLVQRQVFSQQHFYSWALPSFLKHLLPLVLCFGPPSLPLVAPTISCISFSSSLQHSSDLRIQFSNFFSFLFSFHLMNLRCLLDSGNFQIIHFPLYIGLLHPFTYIIPPHIYPVVFQTQQNPNQIFNFILKLAPLTIFVQ